MLRALSELTRLSTISDLGKKVEGIKFNATLPVTIKIKEQITKSEFLLDIGNKKQIKTKSELPLELGKRYWGVLKEHPQTKSISISKLLKQPHFFQNLKNSKLPIVKEQNIDYILKSQNPKEVMKEFLLDNLSKATSRHQFLTISSMVHALEQNVFSFVMTNNKKESILQFRTKKSKKDHSKDKDKRVEEQSIEFYAAFENLGPIEGEVEIVGEEKRLTLYVHYENSLNFLKEELVNLNLQTFLYKKEGKIYPFFEYPSSLLDLKG